jgi:drug/metabolite transporter (DMT)-like permease
MPPYLTGILSAFGEPVFHAWGNTLDNYFSNKVFTRLTALIFISHVTELLFLPIVFLLDPPHALPVSLIPVILVIALIGILYQYPYYWSLRRADTSVVNALFALGEITVPILAFFLVGERIAPIQYAGFFIVIISSVLLTLDFRKLRFNAAFFLMLLVSVLLALQTVLFKYLYEHGTSWGTAMTWTTGVEFLFACIATALPRNARYLSDSVRKVRAYGGLFLLSQFLAWAGEAAGAYAVFLLPATVVVGITDTQPLFVLIYALLFAKIKPELFKEELDLREVSKKALLFFSIIIGVVLIVV